MIKWEMEAELALKAVSTASEFLMNRNEIPKASIKSGHKDVVTEADTYCESLIRNVLSKSSQKIIGEETFKNEDVIEDLQNSEVWFVDPIDGTSNFVSGMPLYGSSVGLFSEGQFVVGAVSVPAMRELFFTYGDNGSFLNGRRLQVKDRDLKAASIVAGFSNSSRFRDQRQKEYNLFGHMNESARSVLRLGSAAINLCYVAEGRLHGAYGFNAYLWDIAGGLAIAKQAGCDIQLKLNPAQMTADYIVGVPTVVAELKRTLKEQGF